MWKKLSKISIFNPVLILILGSLFIAGCAIQSADFELETNDTKDGGNVINNHNGGVETVKILHFGDMMLDRNVKKQIDRHSADYLFEELLGENSFFPNPDIIAANLEGAFADFKRRTAKSIAFCFDPTVLPAIKKYGFSVFNLANNHSADMGGAGFAETQKNLKNAGIEFYGEQYKVGEPSRLIKKVGGKKLGFVGINDIAAKLDVKKALELVADTKTVVDFVIVNAHWGEEYKFLQSNQRQQELARLLIDKGADVVIGHHPHVIQEIEIYKNRPIFHSLGNFIFDQYFSTTTQQGLGLGLEFINGNTLVATIFPIESKSSRVRLMDGKQREELLSKIAEKSRLEPYNLYEGELTLHFDL